jgi:hypothetical protein
MHCRLDKIVKKSEGCAMMNRRHFLKAFVSGILAIPAVASACANPKPKGLLDHLRTPAVKGGTFAELDLKAIEQQLYSLKRVNANEHIDVICSPEAARQIKSWSSTVTGRKSKVYNMGEPRGFLKRKSRGFLVS